MADKISVDIPKDVYEGVEKRVKVTEFNSVEEYVAYVLRQVLEQVGKEPGEAAYSREDEERVKERLRSLGYLD